MFCGNLTWLGQTFQHGRTHLRAALRGLREEGLLAQVVACTDSGMDPRYSERDQIRILMDICGEEGCSIFEPANEPDHGTQSAAVHDVDNLIAWTQGCPVPCSLGAGWERTSADGSPASKDEPTKEGLYPTSIRRPGAWTQVHLDRSRHVIIQIARLRELVNISERYDQPVINGEQVGGDEKGTKRVKDGSRWDGPEAFYQAGAACRVLELGCIWHAQHALTSELPGLNQQLCASSMVQGWRVIDDRAPKDVLLSFRNGSWDDAPLTGRFVDEKAGEDIDTDNRVWRIHNGIWSAGNRAWSVAQGVLGDPGYRHLAGWRDRVLLDEMGRTQIFESER